MPERDSDEIFQIPTFIVLSIKSDAFPLLLFFIIINQTQHFRSGLT